MYFCKVSPSLCGIIFDFLGTEYAAIFIAGWNLVSVTVEYLLLTSIYKEFPGSCLTSPSSVVGHVSGAKS
jgi:hypothetical protein